MRRSFPWLALQVIVATPTVGCGDGLIAGERLNQPLFRIEGEIVGDPRDKAVGILWLDPALEGDGSYVEPSSSAVSEVNDDGTFQLELWSTPVEGAVRWLSDGSENESSVAFAWGEIILYSDGDDDGKFQVGPASKGSPMVGPDRYTGMAPSHVLLYVQQPLRPAPLISGFGEMLGVAGYEVGVAGCDEWPWLDFAATNDVRLKVTPPSIEFPDLRPCLRSHPDREAQ